MGIKFPTLFDLIVLYYLQSRYYDPVTGRFLCLDSALYPQTGVVGINAFAYCNNNPVNCSDPSGNTYLSLERPNYNWQWSSILDCWYAILPNTGYSIYDRERPAPYWAAATSSLPKTGTPNSKQTLPNPDGSPKQQRWYGPDGTPVRDRDYNHPGNMPFPHDHEWKDGVRQKDHLPPDPSYNFNWEPIIGIGLVVICAVGIAAIAADDITGVGFADDFLLGPLGVGVSNGITLILE